MEWDIQRNGKCKGKCSTIDRPSKEWIFLWKSNKNTHFIWMKKNERITLKNENTVKQQKWKKRKSNVITTSTTTNKLRFGFLFGGEVGGCLKFWLDYWTKYLVCSMNKSRYLIFTAALRYLKNKIWKLIYNCSFF